MATMYFITNGIIMTTNNGEDRKDTPFIPFREFLIDVWNGLAITEPQRCQTMFNDLVCDILLKEIKILPREIKLAAMKVVEDLVNEIQEGFKKQKPKQKPNEPCACGSGKKYKKCCNSV
jgi:hypothetical protein